MSFIRDDATFLAVALQYPEGDTPRVVASGENAQAMAIADLARIHGIPVVADYNLVGVLSQVPLGEDIPESLYVAVAEVLAYVFELGEGLDEFG